MEIYLPESPAEIWSKIDSSKQNAKQHFGRMDVDRSKQVSHELRSWLSASHNQSIDDDSLLICSGHQPILYPPGILIKELLAHNLAAEPKGVACNIVVDTDEILIPFDMPAAQKNKNGQLIAIKKRLLLNSGGSIIRQQQLPASRRRQFLQRIEECRHDAPRLFVASENERIQQELARLAELVRECELAYQPGLKLKDAWEKTAGLNIVNIFVSELAASNAFRYFLEFIVQNGDEFRTVYNQAIENYRREHHIKNRAQPIPNLNQEDRELPFWILKDGHRIPFDESCDWKTNLVFPRAITLTLFCRLFLADLLIHGRGGARYEVITDYLLCEFFHTAGAPFTVASATLALDVRADYPVNSRTLQEIDRDRRSYKFDPGRFLPESSELFTERALLLNKLKQASPDRRQLHREIIHLNDRIRGELGALEESLVGERSMAELALKNRSVIQDRNFPFIFYNNEPLLNAVKSYRRAARVNGEVGS